MFWDFVLCAFCIHVLDVRRVRCMSLLLCFGTFCYVPSICVRHKTLCGQHDGLCPFWQPARSIFTVLLDHCTLIFVMIYLVYISSK